MLPTSGLAASPPGEEAIYTRTWTQLDELSATPVTVGDTLILATGRAPIGLRAISARTGEQLWNQFAVAPSSYDAQLKADANLIYFAPKPAHGPSTQDAGPFKVLDTATGKEVWSFTGAPVSDFATGGDMLFITGGDGQLYARSRTDGKALWQQAIPADVKDYPKRVAAGDGIVAVAVQHVNSTLSVLDSSSGKQLWQMPIGDTFRLQVYKDRLIVSGDLQITGYEAGTGKQVWQVPVYGFRRQEEIRDQVLWASGQGTKAGTGEVLAIDPASGQVLQRYPFPASVGPAAITADRIFAVTGPDAEHMELVALDRTSGQERWRSPWRFWDGTPLAAGETLVAREQSALVGLAPKPDLDVADVAPIKNGRLMSRDELTLKFNRPVDPATVSADTVSIAVTTVADGKPISVPVTYQTSGYTVTAHFGSSLPDGTKVSLKVNSGVKSLAGKLLPAEFTRDLDGPAPPPDEQPPKVIYTSVTPSLLYQKEDGSWNDLAITIRTDEPARGYLEAHRYGGGAARTDLSTMDFKTEFSLRWRPDLGPGEYFLSVDLKDEHYNEYIGGTAGRFSVLGGKVSVDAAGTPVAYTVASGDTLGKIAGWFGTTTDALVAANKLDPAKYLSIGQKILLRPAPAAPATVTHLVQAGDTLWKIAQRYGTTVDAIVKANSLNPNAYLQVGQKLVIPQSAAPAPAPVFYTVQSGDSLWKIAQRFGTTIQKLVDLNRLSNAATIYVGQKLQVSA